MPLINAIQRSLLHNLFASFLTACLVISLATVIAARPRRPGDRGDGLVSADCPSGHPDSRCLRHWDPDLYSQWLCPHPAVRHLAGNARGLGAGR